MKASSLFAAVGFAVICAMVSSCSVFNAGYDYQSGSDYYTQAYNGASRADIVSEYGAPDRESPDGLGGMILVYEKTYYSSRYDGWGYITNDVHRRYKQFFLDDHDICYRVMTNELAPQTRSSLLSGVLTGFGVASAVSLAGIITMAIASSRWAYLY